MRFAIKDAKRITNSEGYVASRRSLIIWRLVEQIVGELTEIDRIYQLPSDRMSNMDYRLAI